MIGKSKRLIVPVVAIMMCAVALAGVAYAATLTKVTVDDNVPGGEEFVLEMYDSGAVLVSNPITVAKALDFYTETAIVSGNGDTVTVKADPNSGYIGTLKIRDTGATGSVAITMTAEITDGDEGSIAYTDVSGTEGTLEYTLDVGLYTDSGCTQDYAGTATFADGVATLYYKIFVSETSGYIEFSNATPAADVTAVQTALAILVFDLEFSAVPTAA